ncbi:hypothetical protein [Streptomyces sp. NBC_00212]|uniref:hypothetical protein n=1 Tax=Streptomyces sp. NBC_00212 TaxID=2975684 RepID=UPI002F916C67
MTSAPASPPPIGAAPAPGRRRAAFALTQVLDALGPGVHRLCCSAQEPDGRYVVAEAAVTLPGRLDLALEGLWQVEAALDAAFRDARAEFAVLIAQTFAEPASLACGWRVSGGRL